VLFLPPAILDATDVGDGERFVHALFFAVASLTGRARTYAPQTTAQLVISIVILFVGNIVIAYIIGSIGVLVSSLDAAAVAFRRQCANVDAVMQQFQLPQALQRRATNHLDCMWARGAAVNIHPVLEPLQPILRKDVMNTICRTIISRVPLFNDLSVEFTQSLSEVVTFAAYPLGEWVIRKGTIGTHTYFLMQGRVGIQINDFAVAAEAVHELEHGSFFGERVLLGDFKRNASVRALAYCECMLLSVASFELVSSKFPEVRSKIANEKQRREQEHKLTGDALSKVEACVRAAEEEEKGSHVRRKSKRLSTAGSHDGSFDSTRERTMRRSQGSFDGSSKRARDGRSQEDLEELSDGDGDDVDWDGPGGGGRGSFSFSRKGPGRSTSFRAMASSVCRRSSTEGGKRPSITNEKRLSMTNEPDGSSPSRRLAQGVGARSSFSQGARSSFTQGTRNSFKASTSAKHMLISGRAEDALAAQHAAEVMAINQKRTSDDFPDLPDGTAFATAPSPVPGRPSSGASPTDCLASSSSSPTSADKLPGPPTDSSLAPAASLQAAPSARGKVRVGAPSPSPEAMRPE